MTITQTYYALKNICDDDLALMEKTLRYMLACHERQNERENLKAQCESIKAEYDAMVKSLPHRPRRDYRFNFKAQRLLTLLSLGYTSKEIAYMTSCTEQTTKQYVNTLLKLTGLYNRTSLASYWLTRQALDETDFNA